jgi:tetratricopeptide (TPR) repeat protein
MAREYRLLMDRGHRAYREAQYHDAVQLFDEARWVADAAGDAEDAMAARYWLADSLRVADRDAEAIPHFSAVIGARERLSGSPWHERIGRCYADLVDCMLLQPDALPERLLAILDEGLDWSARHGCRGAEVNLHAVRGDTLSAGGRLEEALVAQEQALAVRRRSPDATAYTFSSAANCLADLLMDQGRSEDYPRVESLVQEALDHDSATPYTQRWSWQVLARLALARGEPARAEAHLGEALHLARHTQGIGLLRVLEQLADLCLDRGRLDEAEAHLREAAGQVVAMLDAVSFGRRYDLTLSLARLRTA